MTKFKYTIIFTLLGAIGGYLYYEFYGCTSGCAIKSNLHYMTGYGALLGFILSFPAKKKEKKVEDEK